VHRRNQITAEFLVYLAKLDERQLFLDLGYSSLFEYCVEKLKLCESTAYERELVKERFAVGRKSRGRGETPASGELSASDVRKSEPAMPELPAANPQPRFSRLKRTRHCAAAVRRAVFLRDGGQCIFVSSDGRRCRARRCLELDHIEPFAVGGEATIENLRLRCRAHNQRYARHYFRVFRLNAAIENFQRRRAPVRGERPGSGEHESRRSRGSARATAERT